MAPHTRRGCRRQRRERGQPEFTIQTAPAGLLYQQESAVTLPSTNSGWDDIKMQPNSSRLFLARDRVSPEQLRGADLPADLIRSTLIVPRGIFARPSMV